MMALSERWRINPRDPAFRRYMIFLAAGFGLLLLWWAADLSDQTGKEVWVVESTDELTFTAGENQTVLTGIGLCADDTDAYAEGTDYISMSGTIHILDEDQNVIWETGFTDLEVPVLQLEEMDGLLSDTLELLSGETYTLICYDSSLNKVTGLTWSFYGEERNAGGLYMLVCIAVILMLSFLYWALLPKDDTIHRSIRQSLLHLHLRNPYTPIFILTGCSAVLIVMAFFSLPDELTEIREAYALSNRILEHLPAVNALSGQIPSGLMRLSNQADAQSMRLFWTDGSYGNVSLPWAEQFTASASGRDLRSLIPALCLSLARILNLPYQWYLILPRFVNALFFIAVLLLVMRLCPVMQRMICAFALLPSVILLMNSFSRKNFDVLVLMLSIALCMRIHGTITSRTNADDTEEASAKAGGKEVDTEPGDYVSPDTRRRRVYIVSAIAAAVVGLVLILTGSYAPVDTTQAVVEWMYSYPMLNFFVYIRTLLGSGDVICDMFAGSYGLASCSILLTAASFLGYLVTALGGMEKPKWAVRFAAAGLIIGVPAIMTSAMLVETDMGYVWSHFLINGLQGVDFLPLLLLFPFVLPSSERAKQYADAAQVWQPAVSALCMLTWFGAALHGIG